MTENNPATKRRTRAAGAVPRMPAMPGLPSMPSMPELPGLPRLPHMPRLPRLPRLTRDIAVESGFSAPIAEAVPADSILDIARTHIGEAYILGARAPMTNKDWKGPWDCAEFCSWCIHQASGVLFGVEPRHDPLRADAYTGYWAQQAREAGAIIELEIAVATAGALLLREPQTGRTGHIAFSDGKGGTIEAHSRNRGVVADKAGGRRWDYGILVPGIRYFTATAPVKLAPAPKGALRLTEPMQRGEDVRALQECLAALGYFPGEADGIFGPQTELALCDFQADQGLLVDGEFGPLTRKQLDKAFAAARKKNRN